MLSIHNHNYSSFDDKESHSNIRMVNMMNNNHITSLPGYSPPESLGLTKSTGIEWPIERAHHYYMNPDTNHIYPSMDFTSYAADPTTAINNAAVSPQPQSANPILWHTSPSTASTSSVPCYTTTPSLFNQDSSDGNTYGLSSADFSLESTQRSVKRYTENAQYSPTDFYQYPNMTSPILYGRAGMLQDIASVKEKFHSRFNSANARLSPYVDHTQSDMYQRYVTSPISPLPMQPQREHHHSSEISANNDKRKHQFQFNAVLHAPTAVLRKENEPAVTYLNRGQSYMIELNTSQNRYPGTMSSTFSLTFHESSHLSISDNYWKFWISQQKNPNEARALDLDTNQTTGIYNIRYPTFDSVSFDWHGRFGAKIYVRFNCLSTDFSRIKGVKGIPMRAVMATTLNYPSLPVGFANYPGSFQTKKIGSTNTEEVDEYTELVYCQIKLFRDKGAERKNKDDSKQVAKQMEKVLQSTNNNPRQHPLWPLLNQKFEPVTVFSEILSPSESPKLKDLPAAIEALPIPLGKKRKHRAQPLIKNKKSRNGSLSIYVWTQSLDKPQEITLEKQTALELKAKLTALLALHLSRVSEILWMRKRQASDKDLQSPHMYVLVEDTFISEHINEGEMMTVDWEIKEDGNVRLILEF